MEQPESSVGIKTEADDISERILALCRDFPRGLSDKVLQNDMPDIDPKIRAGAINQLLNSGKID